MEPNKIALMGSRKLNKTRNLGNKSLMIIAEALKKSECIQDANDWINVRARCPFCGKVLGGNK